MLALCLGLGTFLISKVEHCQEQCLGQSRRQNLLPQHLLQHVSFAFSPMHATQRQVWELRNSTDATQQNNGLQLLVGVRDTFNQTVNFIQLPATGCVSAASVACVGDDRRNRLSHFACLLFVSCAMCVSSCCSSCSLSLSPAGSLPKQADATCVRSLGTASQARMCAEVRQGYSRAEHPHHPCCCAVPAGSQALAEKVSLL